MDTIMDILVILKYIGIGIIAFFAFAIVISITSNILRFLLDIMVFTIIAPFYILFHPIMFVTKPKICFKNILMKTPGIGEDMKRKNPKPIKITKMDEEMDTLKNIRLFGMSKSPYDNTRYWI